MAVAAITVSATVSASTGTVLADHGSDAAKKAAQEIQAARDRANAASQAVFDAESAIDSLDIKIAAAELRLGELEVEAGDMQTGLEEQAVRSFVNAGTGEFSLLIDFDEINDSLTAEVMSAVSRETANVDLDEYDALMTEIADARTDLEQDRADSEQAKGDFADLQRAAEAEIASLAEIEARRLVDEEVEHELERQRQRRQAEAAALAAQQVAQRAAATPAATDGGPSSPPSAGRSAQPAQPSAPQAASPSPEPAAPTPQPDPAHAPTSGAGIVCPVSGPRAFADTWGAPRSGGRRHEGVDMMSPRGTPLVAVEAGQAHFKTNRLGGNAIWLTGASGTKYYYAHLSAWEGSSRTVSKGDVIGYVGATGNTSANHLHFEVHPGGGRAV